MPTLLTDDRPALDAIGAACCRRDHDYVTRKAAKIASPQIVCKDGRSAMPTAIEMHHAAAQSLNR